MTTDPNALATLVAKDEIRDLVLLYSRAVDRKDLALLRTLYADDATDKHGDRFDGTASDYVEELSQSLPHLRYSGHHVCNHLIAVDGDRAEGEVYALAYHVYPDRSGALVEDVKAVRYIDNYRREDGRWLFASRVVEFDYEMLRPATMSAPAGEAQDDASYGALAGRIFARGERA